jgi:hypothetical protein
MNIVKFPPPTTKPATLPFDVRAELTPAEMNLVGAFCARNGLTIGQLMTLLLGDVAELASGNPESWRAAHISLALYGRGLH